MNELYSALISNTIIAAALAFLVAGITQVWRNPYLAHALWLLVLVKLVTPSVLTVPLPLTINPGKSEVIALSANSEQSQRSTNVHVEPNNSPNSMGTFTEPKHQQNIKSASATWIILITALWSGGFVIFVGITVCSYRELAAILNEAIPTSRQLQTEAARISEMIGLQSVPRILITDKIVGSMVTIHPSNPTIFTASKCFDGIR